MAAAPAGAAADPGVVFELPGGGRAEAAAAQLKHGANGFTEGANYVLRSHPGEAGIEIAPPGVPVETAIAAAGQNLRDFGYLTVPRQNGTKAYVPAADFAEPSSVFEGGKPALLYADSGTVRFFRPVTSDPNDVNAEDNIVTVGGESLAIGLHHGQVLTVKGSASPSSTQSGQAVQFAASVEPDTGEAITYHWSFGDGEIADGQSVSHTYTGSGTFEARVTATGSAESGGESDSVAVVVGKPPAAPQTGAAPTPTKHKKKRKPKGPDGKGREGRGGKGSESKHGDGSNKSKGNGKGPSGDGNGNKPSSGSEGSTESPLAPEPSTALPLPTEPLPTPEETPPPEEEAPEAPAPTTAAKQPPKRQTPAAPGETVEGRLIANNLGPLSAAELAEAARSAPSEGSESAPGASPGSGGGSVPLTGLIVVALLAGGALLEWRSPWQRTR